MEKVRRVEAAQGEQQYGESWRVINEMSGHKRSKEGQVAGCSPEERLKRVQRWRRRSPRTDHREWSLNEEYLQQDRDFRDLLGTHPTVDGAEKEITAVLTNLEIDDGPFTLGEFATVKSTLKQGKSAGPDGIPREVLKNCDLDDIILEICNLALMENNKPDIWSLSNIIPMRNEGEDQMRRIKPKAAGPGAITPKVLKTCADQLCHVSATPRTYIHLQRKEDRAIGDDEGLWGFLF
ncbi:hypothetical protein AAFF_G00431520 [Aldrovandia affinis]|uniref:Uncharacterized protein n=1 Tax=Aldrovandia affinis TaxID=143900 RepID=A0AAD7S8T8_9TELE|nr:hypothetical protein AAFF_G00431520 [Aldrovandia affinis]